MFVNVMEKILVIFYQDIFFFLNYFSLFFDVLVGMENCTTLQIA